MDYRFGSDTHQKALYEQLVDDNEMCTAMCLI